MKERRFIVTTIEECADCEGSGLITNPLWAVLFRRYPLALSELTQADIEEWFAGRPPEVDITRTDCHGTGERTGQVSLTEALLELGFAIGEIAR